MNLTRSPLWGAYAVAGIGHMKFIFEVRIKPAHTPEQYAATWVRVSQILQQAPGARGTRLHRKIGDPNRLLAIASWESKSARDAMEVAAMRQCNRFSRRPRSIVISQSLANSTSRSGLSSRPHARRSVQSSTSRRRERSRPTPSSPASIDASSPDADLSRRPPGGRLFERHGKIDRIGSHLNGDRTAPLTLLSPQIAPKSSSIEN
jgi:hypothetical protein